VGQKEVLEMCLKERKELFGKSKKKKTRETSVPEEGIPLITDSTTKKKRTIGILDEPIAWKSENAKWIIFNIHVYTKPRT
jgi:hypothetical protein